jgi:hypothetical protein
MPSFQPSGHRVFGFCKVVPDTWVGLMDTQERGMPGLLTANDIVAAAELSSLAGWNQTAEEWRTCAIAGFEFVEHRQR